MKIIGQPDSYSEILERVFVTTLASGVVCTALLAHASPAFRNFLDSMSTTADVGPLKGIKALYVVIPLAVAVASRAIRLHDRISDILRLRQRFDTHHILFPMADRTGFTLTKNFKERLAAERKPAMYAVFYPYAGFTNSVIDRQLVRTAADNWGWFWVAIEAVFVGLMTLVTLAVLTQWSHVAWLGVALVVLLAFIIFQWFLCRRSAAHQVEAILEDPNRKQAVRAYFAKIAGSPPAIRDGTETPHTIDRERTQAVTSHASVAAPHRMNEWDAFICHASEDKVAVVEPLATELRRRGVKIWYDLWVLQIGDSLRRKIDEGLAKSRYGIVVLSPDFFRKDWPQHELDGLVQREIDGRKVILPIWHNVTRDDVMRYSVTLADKLAGSTDKGIVWLADQLQDVIHTLPPVDEARAPGAETVASLPNEVPDEVLRVLLSKGISAHEFRIMQAMSGKRTFRRLPGLIEETGLTSGQKVMEALTSLMEKQLVQKSLHQSGHDQWNLTDKGWQLKTSIDNQIGESTKIGVVK